MLPQCYIWHDPSNLAPPLQCNGANTDECEWADKLFSFSKGYKNIMASEPKENISE